MNSPLHVFRKKNGRIVIVGTSLFLIIILLISAGCTQPSGTSGSATSEVVLTTSVEPSMTTGSAPAPVKPIKDVTAVATRPDLTKVVITFMGGLDSDDLMELETTVTDSKGTIRIQSMGSRLGTTPVQRGGTNIFYGPFTEQTHVVIIGYFSDGTHQDILDTWV